MTRWTEFVRRIKRDIIPEISLSDHCRDRLKEAGKSDSDLKVIGNESTNGADMLCSRSVRQSCGSREIDLMENRASAPCLPSCPA
jgi:hypothetical protein